MTTKKPRERLQLIIAQSRPDTVLCRYDDADFEYMKDQMIALLEEARQDEREKVKEKTIEIVNTHSRLWVEHAKVQVDFSMIKHSISSL